MRYRCNNRNYIGSRCTLSCRDGYELIGTKSTQCTASGYLPSPRRNRCVRGNLDNGVNSFLSYAIFLKTYFRVATLCNKLWNDFFIKRLLCDTAGRRNKVFYCPRTLCSENFENLTYVFLNTVTH